MKPTITILIGAPLSGDEARFLHKLHADLASTGGLILANFVVDERQLDFVVITATYSGLLELKNFSRPIFGERNGVWKYLDSAGNRVRYAGMNPWQQTLKQKYALSDAMSEYQKRTPDVPGPSGSAFYGDFAAFVCVYPAIHPASRVTAGDHKVQVRSYADILELIRSRGKASTWTPHDWHRFAEEHLSLTAVTLEEATDSRVQDAQAVLDVYGERVRTILGVGLPPLLASTADECGGGQLVTRLLEARNFLVVGPSGSAKTFHLQHAARMIAAGDTEVPLLVDAGRYRGGDFWSVLRQSIAAYCREDAKELLEAVRLCGLKPILLVDALNECADSHLADLLKGIQAFALRFDARVLLTSQQAIELAAELKAEVISLNLPDPKQKRVIYAHHAKVAANSELDRFCAGFTNAYDLTLAGRCHGSGEPPESRVALYDRYVRQCLPENTAVLAALLRTVAAAMSREIAAVIPRDRFERIAERFLIEQSVPIALIDTVEKSRLVRLSHDSFAFEHELLARYFRAEGLLRTTADAAALAAELVRPINHDLVEFVVARFNQPEELADILASTTDLRFLSDVCSGKHGLAAQRVLLGQARELLDAALADVPHLTVRCVTVAGNDRRRVLVDLEIGGARSWTSRDALLCEVIAQNLDEPTLQDKFLSLLDVTEWTLRRAVYSAAKEARFDPGVVWGEAVRLYGGVLLHGSLKVPCTAILCGLRAFSMRWYEHHQKSPLWDRLIDRVGRHPGSHFSLLAVLQDREAAADADRVPENIDLVKRAWASDIYILQIDALEFVQAMSGAVHRAAPDQIDRIREMLNHFDTDNIVVNTSRLEALTSYGGLELALTPDDASAEMRTLIGKDVGNDPELAEIAKLCGATPLEWVASQAYGCLTKIFEDIFQGIYCEAYYDLTDEEKAQVLCLAAQSSDVGYLSDWILQELLKVADARALPVFRRFASKVIHGTTAMAQEAVAAYELGIAGCARWSETPPIYQGGDSPSDHAWRVIGEILFWVHRGRFVRDTPELTPLWEQLEGDTLIAAGDVLYHLTNVGWRAREDALEGPNLVHRFPAQVRRIALAGLEHTGNVPSVFPHSSILYGGLAGFMLSSLGIVGVEADVSVLRRFVEDTNVGRIAVAAIEHINGVRV